jgi:hypothetical protein
MPTTTPNAEQLELALGRSFAYLQVGVLEIFHELLTFVIKI